MDIREKLWLWQTDPYFDQSTRQEAMVIKDLYEIQERFGAELTFGTGGIRALMGVGTNRLNRYTVGKATTGLGKYLLSTYGEAKCSMHGVVICYDTRFNSYKFAKVTADVLSGMGIRALLFREPRPTPQLSYSVHALHALAGVVITASHNSKEYNGYKVYDENGVQITLQKAEEIAAAIHAIKDIREVRFAKNATIIELVDTTDAFIEAVLAQNRLDDPVGKASLKVVYTPLHGTGRVPVPEALRRDGFVDVTLVQEQADDDGAFSTVPTPNPEDARTLRKAIALAEKMDADIVLGTDPDCDRVGVAVRTKENFKLLTGNQIGALLVDYVTEHTNLRRYKRPTIIKTEVTSEFGAEIARNRGLSIFSTLTGFKFIGEKITQFERAKVEKDEKGAYDFIMGYEESYGYLVGDHARDKDAVVSAMLICEMTAFWKAQRKNLLDRLEELYAQFGYYRDALDSYTLEGSKGTARIEEIMESLRRNVSPFLNTKKVIDYISPVPAEEGFDCLPAANVIKYVLENGSWIAVRPSGTEPKIKIYYSMRAANRQGAEEALTLARKTITNVTKLDGRE